MEVEVINLSQNELPKYETLFSAGMDVKADFSRIKLVDSKPEKFFFDADVVGIVTGRATTIEIKPGGRCLIPTGLFVAIPQGYEIQIRMRSGLALKMGLSLANGIATIDSDYRGELGIILINTSNVPVRINDKERIAQLVLAKHETTTWKEVTELTPTDRGEGGFGHTGK